VKTYKILLKSIDRDPVELIAELAHDRRARQFARERLESLPQFVAIEVWDGEARLCRLVAGGEPGAVAA
jgi:hypothetical protein